MNIITFKFPGAHDDAEIDVFLGTKRSVVTRGRSGKLDERRGVKNIGKQELWIHGTNYVKQE